MFEVYRTCLEMLHDRNYIVPYLLQDGTDKRAPQNKKRSSDWFYKTFTQGRPDLASVFRHRNREHQLYLMFHSGDVGKDVLLKLISRFNPNITQCIFVFSQKPTAPACKILHEINTDDNPRVQLQWFYEEELLINYFKGNASIYEGMYPHKSGPCIGTDDWDARYLGARIGDVIRIRRTSETAGRYTNYRRVSHKESLPKEQLVKRLKTV